MRTTKYTFRQNGEFYIGFLNNYPNYETQGFSKEELLENLKSLLKDIKKINENSAKPIIKKLSGK